MSSPTGPNNVSAKAPPLRGFWATTWDHKSELLNWDLYVAIVLAGVGTYFVNGKTLTSTLPTLLVADFGVVAALLGLVIAGLAIVVAFMGSDYAAVLARAEDGPSSEFWPFWYVAAVAAAAVIVAGAALLAINQHPGLARTAFVVTTFLTSYVLLASVNLVGFIKAQGETRAWQLARRAAKENGAS